MNYDIESIFGENTHLLEDYYLKESQLMRAVSLGNFSKAEPILSDLISLQYSLPISTTLKSLQNYLYSFNTLLRTAAMNGSVHPIHIGKLSTQYINEIEQLSSVPKGHMLMNEMVRKYCMLVKNYSLKNYSLLIQKVLTLIDYDLTADLGLKAIAETLNVNASYLSSLFKKETGSTLTEYVNKKRVERAIFLLNTTSLQVQTIAQYCGIPDVNYFTKVFKKIIGKTPKEYRAEISILD